MTAQEYIEERVDSDYQDKATVLGVTGDGHWWHVHRDEEVPDKVVVSIKA